MCAVVCALRTSSHVLHPYIMPTIFQQPRHNLTPKVSLKDDGKNVLNSVVPEWLFAVPEPHIVDQVRSTAPNLNRVRDSRHYTADTMICARRYRNMLHGTHVLETPELADGVPHILRDKCRRRHCVARLHSNKGVLLINASQ